MDTVTVRPIFHQSGSPCVQDEEAVPESLTKSSNSAFAGSFWIFVFDLIADAVWSRILQLTHIYFAVPGKFMDDRFRCNHPGICIFPETVEQCDRIRRNMWSGYRRKPAVVPDLKIVIPT